VATKHNGTKQGQGARLQRHKALSHQLRVEILTFLTEHSTGSPGEMARALGASVSDVSHHTKQLVHYGMAELVEERPARRGSPVHVYRATERPVVDVPELEKMDLSAQRGFVGQIALKVREDLEAGFRNGSFEDRTDWHLTRTPLNLDAEGWRELLEVARRAFEEAMDVQARSDGRRLKSGEEPIRVSSSLLYFEMPPR
jgi:DNA-binding transcriptional ArsR family regulator